jgi:predicted acylesterase/phospholipase RssA
VNALRQRRIYRDASLRLLSDLIDVGRNSPNRDGDAAAGDDDVGELEADYHLVRHAAESSACLFRSLRLRRRLAGMKERPAAHAVLVAREGGVSAPVDALAQLLAASIARYFDEIAVAVNFTGAAAKVTVWMGQELAGTDDVATYEELLAAVKKVIRDHGVADEEPFLHVIVAAGGSPKDIPAGFVHPRRPFWHDEKRFGPLPTGYDRVVYLAREVPDSAPEDWVRLLGAAVRPTLPDSKRIDPRGPYFGSFVATIVPHAASPRRTEFASEAMDGELQTPRRSRGSEPPGLRLRRDACRLPLDMDDLDRRWTASAAGAKAFVDGVLKEKATREHAERWARAVTNRRVGVALSGGGASSYRLVPLLKALEDGAVPIDVLSGVSGGALLGAYYCAERMEGVEKCIGRGPWFQLATLTGFVQPQRIRELVDEDLGGVTLDETNIRFVAVTTALLDEDPPETRAVSAGTLGSAVQASGAAPLLLAPIEAGGERFSDGASAALIPGRILKDYGADFVFAFNCLPGPPRRNPLDGIPLFRALYEYTPVGSLIDLWVSAGSMMQRLSREACEDAHVYFEPSKNELFLLESVLFARARNIAQRGASDVELVAADCVKTWQRLRRGKTAANRQLALPKARLTKSRRAAPSRRRSGVAAGAAKRGKGKKRAPAAKAAPARRRRPR